MKRHQNTGTGKGCLSLFGKPKDRALLKHFFFLKNVAESWGDDSVGKVLALQV